MNIIYDNPWVRSFVAANPTYQLGARAPKGSWFFLYLYHAATGFCVKPPS